MLASFIQLVRHGTSFYLIEIGAELYKCQVQHGILLSYDENSGAMGTFYIKFV